MDKKDFYILRVTNYLYLLVLTNCKTDDLDTLQSKLDTDFPNIRTKKVGTYDRDYSYCTLEIKNTKKETLSDDIFACIYSNVKSL